MLDAASSMAATLRTTGIEFTLFVARTHRAFEEARLAPWTRT